MVDDDFEISGIIKDVLVAAGYEVQICENGLEAVKAIQDYNPDLLLLDVMLPGIDGFTLATQITESKATCELPIIILSGLEPSGPMFQRFRQVKAFMTKPYSPQDLLENIKQALDKT